MMGACLRAVSAQALPHGIIIPTDRPSVPPCPPGALQPVALMSPLESSRMHPDHEAPAQGVGERPQAAPHEPEPRLHQVQCLHPGGLHRMAWWEWGDPLAPRVVVCVHGLSRQGRDFDELARDLVRDGGVRVVCPDVVGRGRSDWLRDPSGYAIPQYVADMVTLLARLNATEVDWVGTSMGGLIGLGVAALQDSPIRRLVLNDVGPTIQFEALERIGRYLGLPVRFANLEQAADAMWAVSTSFGPHTRDQWLALSRPQLRPDGQGGLLPHYDPSIAVPFRAVTREVAAAGEAALWAAWGQVRCPTLLLRGAESDLLSRETAQRMAASGPQPRVHEFSGVGHAPTLVQPDQRQVVRDFLFGAQ